MDASQDQAHEDRERRESAAPGGGRGRRDEVGRTGIWPASGPLPAGGDVPTVGQGELGQGMSRGAGYQDAGEPGAIVFRSDPVCGVRVNPEHAERSEHDRDTYYFDSADCKRQFEQAPERYTRTPDTRKGRGLPAAVTAARTIPVSPPPRA